MPALTPVSPRALKRILELYGYQLHKEDDYNWLLVRGTEEPVVVPKKGARVAIEVMMGALHRAQMNTETFFLLHARAELGDKKPPGSA